jgi:hypothetical protein
MENPQANEPQKDSKGTDMEPLNDFDQNHFYDTDHIDSKAFSEHNRSNEDLGYQEISGTASLSDRIEEEAYINQKEIHFPVEHSKPTKADGDVLMNVGRAPDS